MEIERPNPEKLLDQVNQDSKHIGKLTIFFGACAGAGKTYTMLSHAKEEIKDGKDVVAGIVETHGRTETSRLLEGIRLLPLIEINHHGLIVKELDLDGAIKLNPTILLVDELAHTNPANARHPKRWQDVQELLQSGIDIYTTLNVQHLESLNDMIANITGIRVKETIPDSIFDKADEIVLVDIPSEIILERLHEGKVYLGEFAKQRAAQHFFKMENLIALREIALRRTAERVDALRDTYQHYQPGSKKQAIASRILVCINSKTSATKLIRKAKQQAVNLKCPWTALYIENYQHYKLSKDEQMNIEKTFRLAEQLGAKTRILQENTIVEAIIHYAMTKNFTRIIVGKSSKPWWKRKFFGSLVGRLIEQCSEIDIYVVSDEPVKEKENRPVHFHSNLLGYLAAFLVITICTLLGLPVKAWLNPENVLMIYLAGVVIVSTGSNRSVAVFAAIFSVLCYKFFFTKPYYTFVFYTYHIQDLVTIGVLLLTGLTISTLTSKLHLQNLFSRQHEKYIGGLYEFSRKMIVPSEKTKIAVVAAHYISETFNSDVTLWLPNDKGSLPLTPYPLVNVDIKEESVAGWAFTHHQRAGLGTDTMPSAKGYYIPFSNGKNTFGVLGIIPKEAHRTFNSEDNMMLDALILQMALAFERINASEKT